MPWKTTVLTDYDEKGIADSATIEIVKLPQAVISAIHMRLSGTGGSGTPAVDNLLATTKIKTEKGYVFDMRSADMHVLARKKCGRKPTITNASGAYTSVNHSIYFGRFPKDKALMMNLMNSNVRQMELTFGTLIATTAWATGTVKLTITIEEWLGANEIKGFLGAKEVEDKATGTGKCTFELFQGGKLAGLLINVGTITTIRQVTIGDKKESVIFGKANFRDLLNIHNIEFLNIDAVETLYAYWSFLDKKDIADLPLLTMSDPVVTIERGATTSTTRLVQEDLVI